MRGIEGEKMEYGDHCPDVVQKNMQYEGGASIGKKIGDGCRDERKMMCGG
jgi:hypothetical protein